MSIPELAQKLDAVNTADEEERKLLLQACDRLKSRLETPFDFTARLSFSGHQAMAIRLAVDLKLFDTIARLSTQSQDGFFTTDQLSESTDAEPLLVTRIISFLAAMGVVQEIDRGTYVQTKLAASYVSSSPLSAGIIHSTHFLTVLSRLPEYFHEKGWQSPGDAWDGPFQYALGTNAHYFDFLSSHPYYQQAFNTVMAMSFRRHGRDWFELFPVEERLRVQNDTDPLIVDVGGSQGKDLKMFKERFPHLPGKLILQDLPSVTANAQSLPPGIEVQGHDFFHEQPVRNARAYLMRTVLHDWPDKQAVQILGRLRAAMNRDSRLLISEYMRPESNVSFSSGLADIHMMTSFASLERTQQQWKTLLETAGFELIQVWLPDGCDAASESLAEQAALLEARVKE
ncbi:hypothetical protein NUU61_009239 [Penicillium alfredii]|uniref:O-methyltransferase domain-containing protein n=1 Tax=Penicillium alfredii TaxID=1506179 RepID=A0A9W9JX30_9EURO|nr:uncharacterized protein NUU61_009239 [Penicillium alfredii]KAJ5084660.1 hypothetical protein NUU61_009239 [Penicillium alfredii]